MPYVKPHHHPCQDCGAKTECGGAWEENYDGEPPIICREFHLEGGTLNQDFICEACFAKWNTEAYRDRLRAANARGGYAAAIEVMTHRALVNFQRRLEKARS